MSGIVHSVSGDRIVTITLDSPANRNALSRRLVAQLRDALAAAAAVGTDGTAHAVLLTHTGTTFCSGAALDEMRDGDPADGTRAMLALFRQLLTLPIPVVARVDGAARAGGLGVLGACDVVLASARSTFAFTEARLGLAPALISLPLRLLLTGRAAARETGALGRPGAPQGEVNRRCSSSSMASAPAFTASGMSYWGRDAPILT